MHCCILSTFYWEMAGKMLMLWGLYLSSKKVTTECGPAPLQELPCVCRGKHPLLPCSWSSWLQKWYCQNNRFSLFSSFCLQWWSTGLPHVSPDSPDYRDFCTPYYVSSYFFTLLFITIVFPCHWLSLPPDNLSIITFPPSVPVLLNPYPNLIFLTQLPMLSWPYGITEMVT